jgi:hypothetical protein
LAIKDSKSSSIAVYLIIPLPAGHISVIFCVFKDYSLLLTAKEVGFSKELKIL